MHSAPAVSYPVGRSRFQGQLVGMLAGFGCLAGLVWWSLVDVAGWRQGLFFAIWVLTCGLAIQAWFRSPVGALTWDGEAWRFSVDHGVISGNLRLHLDLQFCMLLCLRSEDAGRLWLWPERRTAAAGWLALRRAVVSSVAARASGLTAGAASTINP
jgi:hypothetical protein